MDNLKGALECAKDELNMISPDMALDPRFGHMMLALHYLVLAVEGLEGWQHMLLELHKAQERMPLEPTRQA